MTSEKVRQSQRGRICSETTDKEQFLTLGKGLLVRAPAKINLTLLIAGKRPDGFHELETIMAKIDWYDEIFIEPGDNKGTELICTGPCWAPEGPDNLVYRACKLLFEKAGKDWPVRVTLKKNIPAGTGLGSASSDAASTLIGVNKFLNLGFEPNELSQMAGQLGSDVAFFIDGPAAFCTGRGEKVAPLREVFDFSALLVVPDISVSTKSIYENYLHDKELYDQLSGQIQYCFREKDIDFSPRICVNMLQRTCLETHKELAQLKEAIESLGVEPLCLSGSGSAMFYLRAGRDDAELKNYQRIVKAETGVDSVIVHNNKW